MLSEKKTRTLVAGMQSYRGLENYTIATPKKIVLGQL